MIRSKTTIGTKVTTKVREEKVERLVINRNDRTNSFRSTAVIEARISDINDRSYTEVKPSLCQETVRIVDICNIIGIKRNKIGADETNGRIRGCSTGIALAGNKQVLQGQASVVLTRTKEQCIVERIRVTGIVKHGVGNLKIRFTGGSLIINIGTAIQKCKTVNRHIRIAGNLLNKDSAGNRSFNT
ncbi:MAG: hypothetical protein IJN82_05090 [Clostridia bacterium]|nr:hypothetical protein [Clostridia bacterium]